MHRPAIPLLLVLQGRSGPKNIVRSITRRPDVRFLEKKTSPAQRLIGLGYLLMLCLPLLTYRKGRSAPSGKSREGLLFSDTNCRSKNAITYIPHDRRWVILPFLTGRDCRIYAAILSFWIGVIPPIPMFGRSLLYVHSHLVA